MMQKWMKLSLMTLLVVTTVIGCRNSRRGVRVGGDAAMAKVYVNFPDHKFDAKAFTYEMSACEGIPALVGSPSDDLTYVTFKAVGLKPGMVCQLRVKDLAADTNTITFTGEENVLFWASQVVLVQDAGGTLKSNEVSLTPLYTIKPEPGIDRYKLRVPVLFTEEPTGKPNTATIKCEPKIVNLSDSWGIEGKEAWYEFDLPLVASEEITCTEITAYEGGDVIYKGKLEPAFQFTPEKDVKTVVDQRVEIKRFTNGTTNPDNPENPGENPDGPGTGDNPTDVTVEAEAKDCTAEGSYYDVEKRECITAEAPE